MARLALLSVLLCLCFIALLDLNFDFRFSDRWRNGGRTFITLGRTKRNATEIRDEQYLSLEINRQLCTYFTLSDRCFGLA